MAIVTFVALVSCALGQAGMDDGGGNEDTGNDDLSSQDPGLVNPTNKQGYGRDVPTQLVDVNEKKSGGKGTNKKGSKQTAQTPPTMIEQTIQAALQFGVLVRRVFQLHK